MILSFSLMRLCHTSDWHLGHTLHDLPREAEHARFLGWLLDLLAVEKVDALVVTGDLFETANPPASAQQALYDFFAEARRRLPSLGIVVVGGNHDSASRLDAIAPLCRAIGIHVIGSLPRREDGRLDEDRLLVPLRDATGEVGAWVAAVPFLRPMDLPPSTGDDPLVAGVRAVYEDALIAARARRRPGQAIVVTGHCYMVGGRISELSERKVLGGNQHALPIDLFPDDVSYAALGHLHLGQRVDGRDHVRYAGSPIPLSMGEAGYKHHVLLVDLDGERPARVRERRVPRAVKMLRVPERGPRPLAEVLRLLAALDDRVPGSRESERPYLAVDVSLPAPEPGLRRRVEEALEGKQARLVQLSVAYQGDGRSLADAPPAADLREVVPEEVFRRAYLRRHAGDPPADLLAAFHELVEQAHADTGGRS
jgi:exonuclease SbcD